MTTSAVPWQFNVQQEAVVGRKVSLVWLRSTIQCTISLCVNLSLQHELEHLSLGPEPLQAATGRPR